MLAKRIAITTAWWKKYRNTNCNTFNEALQVLQRYCNCKIYCNSFCNTRTKNSFLNETFCRLLPFYQFLCVFDSVNFAAFYLIHFTLRRVRIARTMPWQDVCPSVRPSVTRRYFCLNGYTYPWSFFHHREPHHSNFSVLNGVAIFRRDPHSGGVECMEVWKITIFDKYLALSRKWCKIRP